MLAMTGGVGLLPGISIGAEGPRYLSACRNKDGSYAAALLDGNGNIVFSAALPGRGHGFAIDPPGSKAVVFARRPGEFALVLDIERRTSTSTIQAVANRHFYGHGFFAPRGDLLYASENAYDVSQGRIGIYEAASGFNRLGEIPTGGIGPHEALLLPDGETIVVANGGILTHPDFRRQKLNLPMMEPSLAYLDRRSGRIVEQVALPAHLHQLSIRHLCLDRRGVVWFGCQYEGPAHDVVPLVGYHRRGRPPELIELPPGTTRALRNYVGSIAADRSGSLIGATSSRGGTAVVWDTRSHRMINQFRFPSATGIAPGRSASFMVTSGRGRFLDASSATPKQSKVRWDNHLTGLST